MSSTHLLLVAALRAALLLVAASGAALQCYGNYWSPKSHASSETQG